MDFVVLNEVDVAAFLQQLGDDLQLNAVDAGGPHEISPQQEGRVEYESCVRFAGRGGWPDLVWIRYVMELRYGQRFMRRVPPVR